MVCSGEPFSSHPACHRIGRKHGPRFESIDDKKKTRSDRLRGRSSRGSDRKQTGEIETMEEKKNGGSSSGSGPGANLPMQKIKNMMKSNERCAAESPRRAPSQPAPEVACAVPVERPSLDSPGLPDLSAGLRAALVPGFLPRSCPVVCISRSGCATLRGWPVGVCRA